MAQKVQVLLEDDLSGGPAEGTVRFGLDGTAYEIDLNEENTAKLRNSLAPYVEHARKVTGTRQRRTRGASSRERSADIRSWAKSAGIHVNERGRIPADVVAKYDAAH
jgi:Lsr2